MFVIDWMEQKTVSTLSALQEDMVGLSLIFITLRNALSGSTVEESGMDDEDTKIYNAITKDGCTAAELLPMVEKPNKYRKRVPAAVVRRSTQRWQKFFQRFKPQSVFKPFFLIRLFSGLNRF